ncbi:MAG: phytanoyl-CoA dioxygenase, partial [Candidatus Eremiobacteraeota bacterium]|nr:phytanoyl-CoA dioxygenase [Candidatus Eremiobacteraeota bacterium]
MATNVRYGAAEHERFANEVRRESFCVLRDHLDRTALRAWGETFAPLLEANVKTAADDPNRGPQRFYVTLPFAGAFADPRIVFDPDVLAICARLVGDDMVMCQLA